MKKIDSVYLEDILEALAKLNEFIDGLSFSEFESDDRTQFAVFHALEIIGEASNKLSEDFLVRNPNFPAKQAVEMRNFLIHGYDEIRVDIVWKTIKDDLPKLKEVVQQIISDE